MPPKAQIGLLIPSIFSGPIPEPREFTEFFQAADDLGFHSLWAVEVIIDQTAVVDVFPNLAWAAALTRRIKLGSAVVLATLRHPLLLAKAAIGLHYISGDGLR